mgnify:CR=1 FL=1
MAVVPEKSALEIKVEELEARVSAIEEKLPKVIEYEWPRQPAPFPSITFAASEPEPVKKRRGRPRKKKA